MPPKQIRLVLTLLITLGFTSLLSFALFPTLSDGAILDAAPLSSIVYVDKNATGANNGSSWSNAYTDLQNALTNASSGDELWVATGVYTPGASVANSFQLVDNLSLYGGFDGSETALDQRDWETNITVLSGDIDGDDSADPHGVVVTTTNQVGNNNYHVVVGNAADSTAILDGFTITAGQADGSGSADLGGGIYIDQDGPTLSNLVISGNSATVGGGIGNFNSDAAMTNLTVSGNSADTGGGIANVYSDPVMINLTVSGNSAESDGGGIYNYTSNAIMTNIAIFGNSADLGGGLQNFYSNPIMTNLSISGNSADTSGGGIYNDADSEVQLTNSIVYNNRASGSLTTTSASIANSISSINNVSYSIIDNSGGSSSWESNIGTDSGNNLDIDPLFVTSISASAAPTSTGDIQLQPSSPAIDAGNTLSYTSAITTDLAGNERIFSGVIDLGAYESQSACPGNSIVYVNQNAGGGNNGKSWNNAFTGLQDGLTLASGCGSEVTEVWVASGVYTPGIATTDSFELLASLGIYGGFVGTETMRSERDWEANIAVLSGDIDGDDIINTNGVVVTYTNQVGDNSYHVVSGNGVTQTAVLDGFTITAGQADGTDPYDTGAGLNLNSANPTLSNLTIAGNWADAEGGGMNNESSDPAMTHITIYGNGAYYSGGGIFNRESEPLMSNITVTGNSAGFSGGGIYNYNCNLIIMTNLVVSENTARSGAGIYNDISTTVLTHSIISGNSASSSGGGIYHSRDTLIFFNSQVTGNTAGSNGGGIYNYNTTGSNPKLANLTISGNSAGLDGGGIYNHSGNLNVLNTIIHSNQASGSVTTTSASLYKNSGTPSISYSLVENSGGSSAWESSIGTDNGNNVDDDAHFAAAIDPSAAPSITGDFRLNWSSAALDAGDNTSYNNVYATDIYTGDLAGNDRIQNTTIDMGAYEMGVTNLEVIFDGLGDGTVSGLLSDCTTDCNQNIVSDATLTLTATPDLGYVFNGWTRDCIAYGTDPCVVTLDEAKNVGAFFSTSQYAASILTFGDGSGTVSSDPTGIDCGLTCLDSYDYGTVVTLTAEADIGSTFDGWSGSACSIFGTDPCVITITENTAIGASFSTIKNTVNASTSGSGVGDITSNPSGLNCGSTCSYDFNYGTVVTLTAVADSGSSFEGWLDSDCSSFGTNPCVITLTANSDVEADFSINQLPVGISKMGDGSGTVTRYRNRTRMKSTHNKRSR
ncbi:MAG: choice-of-anchor Q domain-containing protein, partial [Chloroflexota bacterium]